MNEQQEKLGTLPFVIGGMSFIPGMGIIFGTIAITWGLVTKKLGAKKLTIIGICGICFNIIIYSSLFYFGFVQRGGLYDDMRLKLSKSTITSLVQAIEFYKIQNGSYPDSLETLQKSSEENSMILIFDLTDVKMTEQPRYYYYELIDNEHYYLLGVGTDRKPFTADDILPNVKVDKNSKVGLVIKSPKNTK